MSTADENAPGGVAPGDPHLPGTSAGQVPWVPRFVRRSFRRGWRWLSHPHLEVVYHEDYNHAFPTIPNDPLRAERILAFLASEGLILRRDVHTPLPVSLKTLARVHDPDYLGKVHEVTTLTSILGGEVTVDQVDRVLDLQRLQTGGTVLATRLAKRHGLVVNLGGGFHHARAHQGGGFCIFNDVAVAVADARARGFRGKVLVVDLDLHDGDGTREVFADDPSVFTFSIHARDWEEAAADIQGSLSVELGTKVDDAAYLTAVDEHLPRLLRRFRPRLVFYLAGCDPAREDKLGDWTITPAAMLRRDQRVASLVRASRIPLVVLLAGGYSSESWRYSARFLSSPLGAQKAIEPPSTTAMTFKRYNYLTGLFDATELSGADAGDEFGFTEEDLYLPGWSAQQETRFLGYYTRHGIELVLERARILDRLRDLGFRHPTLEFDLGHPGGHSLRIYADPSKNEVLMEMRLQRDRRTIPGMELLSIEWLLLQNPRMSFGALRSRLPGQEYPGLGMLKDVVAMLAASCRRLHLDGVIYTPSTYHVAFLWHRRLAFVDAEAAARFEALRRALADLPLDEATRAVDEGRVVDEATGEVVQWQPAPMVTPISRRLRRRWKERRDETSELSYVLSPRGDQGGETLR